MKENILTLHLKGEYFDQIKSGEKLFEYRLKNDYWTRRLIEKNGLAKPFRRIMLCRGYPAKGDQENRMIRPWFGLTVETITHPHFGTDPVGVYSIPVNVEPKDRDGKIIKAEDYVSLSGLMTADDSMSWLPNGWSFDDDDVFRVYFDDRIGTLSLDMGVGLDSEHNTKLLNHALSLLYSGSVKKVEQ